jgi:hypothetical protein
MRILWTSLAVTMAAILLASAVPAQAAKRKAKPSCAKKGSRTVLRGPGVRVFTAPGRSEGEDVERLYGCLSANGRKQVLAESSDDGYVTSSGYDDVQLAGRYVAWHSSATDVSCKADCPPGYNPTRDGVEVYDLRRRRSVRTVLLLTPYTQFSLALAHNGGAAWLSHTTPGPQQLNVADRGGLRVLDTGAILAGSLTAEISIISWVRDGVERFARLR